MSSQISSFAERIRAFRDSHGCSLAELSDITNIPAQTLSRYELGQRVPKINVAVQIADAICVDPLWLMGYDVKPTASPAPILTEEALAIAHIYDHLDAHGQSILRTVADLEAERCDSHMDPMSDVDADFREQMSSKGRLASQAE